MPETPQQYTQRILGYLEGKKPIEILAATPRQIARLVKGVSRRTLSKRKDSDKWSVAEILAHLADSEVVVGYRIRHVLGATGTAIQSFDQNVWAKVSDYAKHHPTLSLEALRANRERLVHLLKSLPREHWDFHGIHAERGKETITRMVEMLAGHDINHLRQIKERLGRGRRAKIAIR